jgi:hypothetical protein
MKKLNNTVVIAHHPCPDGLGSLVAMVDKYGYSSNVTYAGLAQGDLTVMEQEIFKAIATQPQGADIVFVDIAPHPTILKTILEQTSGKIIILDHHESAIHHMQENSALLAPYQDRLVLNMRNERSGAGLAHEFVHPAKKQPLYISLIQTIDLFTATSDIKVVKTFKIPAETFAGQEALLTTLGTLSGNKEINDSIEFYLLAAVIDEQIKYLNRKYSFQMTNNFIREAKEFFDTINEKGLSHLLEMKIPMTDGNTYNAEELFRNQIALQKKAVNEAVVIPSPLKNKNFLLINANNETGRTFDAFISQRLEIENKTTPTYAMIIDVPKNAVDFDSATSQDTIIKASLRKQSGDVTNLGAIAVAIAKSGGAMNGGGHSSAAVLSLSKAQLLKILEASDKARANTQTPVIKLSRKHG